MPLATSSPEPSGAALSPAGLLVLEGARQAIGTLFFGVFSQLLVSLWLFVMIVLLKLVLRKTWLAVAVVVLLNVLLVGAGMGQFGGTAALTGLVVGLIDGLATVFLLFRFGLLAFFSYQLTVGILNVYPLTADTTAPFFGLGLFGALLILGLAGFAFYHSLAGRSVFAEELLEA